MLAHESVQVRETGVVEGPLDGVAAFQGRVPQLKGFHEPDETAFAVAAERLGCVVCVGGDEGAAVLGRVLGAHDAVPRGSLGDFERLVDFGGVVFCDDFEEGPLGGGAERYFRGGLWQAGCGDGDGEEAPPFGAGGEAGDGADGGDSEIFPYSEVADVPPEVGLEAGARCYPVDELDCWIGLGQVVHESGCWA